MPQIFSEFKARFRPFRSAAHQASLLVILIASVLHASTSAAQSITGPVNGFTRSVWSRNDGVPDIITCLAQTPDGWIWMTSKDQLYRFDGVTAEKYPVKPNDGTSIVALLATRTGDVWIVHLSGLTVQLPHGNFAHPIVIDGMKGVAKSLIEDSSGNIWAMTNNALFEESAGAWQPISPWATHKPRTYFDIAMDTNGTLWVLADTGILALEKGKPSFVQRDDINRDQKWDDLKKLDALSLSQNEILSKLYLPTLLEARGITIVPNYFSSRWGGMFDSSKGEWLILAGSVTRLSNPTVAELNHFIANIIQGKLHSVTGANSMTTDSPITILEDRQHNVWITTEHGLERFQPAIAKALSVPRGYSAYAMIPGDHGTIWFGDAVYAETPGWWHADQSAVLSKKFRLDVTVAFRDFDGKVLLGTGTGFIYRGLDEDFKPLDNLPPGSGQNDDVILIARDGVHHLWVGLAGHALYELSNGQWLKNGGLPQLPENGALRAVTDARGRLWVSYPDQVFVIDGTQVHRYGAEEGMTIQNVRDIIPDGIPLVAGDSGLATFDGQRFHEIQAATPQVLTRLNGMVRLEDGTLWLNGHEGAVRITPEELSRGVEDPGYRILITSFGPESGMPGVAQGNRPVPSLIRGDDGRLWFADSEGIAWLDPAAIPADSEKPTVVIRSVTVANRAYHSEDLITLSAGTRSFQIDYTVIGLRNPSKARFRYALSRIDPTWQEVETRREAFYTNLGPGRYVFRVEASTEDGSWTSNDARIAILIEPYFYQTYWFVAFLAILALSLLWLAHLYRLKILTRNLRQRLDERYAERERIARELHDNYLQTVQALLYKVHAIRRSLPEGSIRESITNAAALADQAIVEGRDRVRSLRTTIDGDLNLAFAFEKLANEFVDMDNVTYSVTTSGRPRHVNPIANDELYTSGREAIINAFLHADATKIDVFVEYGRNGIHIHVADNGIGIPEDVLSAGGRAGHWGLRGMRERMTSIGGECRIHSQINEGTSVTLYLDASAAYVKGK